MRFVRIAYDGATSYALAEKDGYRLISLPHGQPESGLTELVPYETAMLLAPVVPSKIIAIGLNYKSHAHEMAMPIPENPVMFLKPLTALANPYEKIQIPACSRQVDYEGELAVVIGAKGRCIPEERALSHVMGYTLANDITARDLQKLDGQWTRAKGFDGFCPIGPCIRTGILPDELSFKTYLNDELRQTGYVRDMIFTIPRIIAFVSEVMTLLPGDVILTGTPPGIGPMQQGDRIRVECDAIGVLENTVSSI